MESPDFLLRAAAESLLDRLDDTTRRFPFAIDLGAHAGQLAEMIGGRGGVETLVAVEAAPEMAALAAARGPVVIADEADLPFEDASVDLVLSCMSLHWINDFPALLAEVHRVLKPEGLFLAVLPGEETLRELRDSLARAELAVEGGVSPRVAPMLTVKDGGALLQRAGFAAPVADVERVTVDYGEPLRLLADLRAMGETNVLTERRRTPLRRATLIEAMRLYAEEHADARGRAVATFDLVTLTAWKP